MIMGEEDPKKQSCLRRLVPSTLNLAGNSHPYYVSGLTYNHDGSEILVSYAGDNIYTFASEGSEVSTSKMYSLKRQAASYNKTTTEQKKRVREDSSDQSPLTSPSISRASSIAESAARFAQAVRARTLPTDPTTHELIPPNTPNEHPNETNTMADLENDIRTIFDQLQNQLNIPRSPSSDDSGDFPPDEEPMEISPNEIPPPMMMNENPDSRGTASPFLQFNFVPPPFRPGEGNLDEGDNSLRRTRDEPDTFQPPYDQKFTRCYSGHRNSGTAMGVNYFGPNPNI